MTSTQHADQMPIAPDAELALMGGILLDGSISDRARGLKPEHIFSPTARKIYKAFLAIDERGGEFNPITLTEKLRARGDLDYIGGQAFIATLTDRAIRGSQDSYVDLIIDAANRRDLQNIGAELDHGSKNGKTPAQSAERAIARLQRLTSRSSADAHPGQERTPIQWPEALGETAYHGLAGDIVRAIDPHTEADPAALLVQFLVSFGNLIKRSAHFIAEADRHYCNM